MAPTCLYPTLEDSPTQDRYLFPKEIPTLRISLGCDALAPIQNHEWILELILSCQVLELLQNQTQRWVFQKIQGEAIVVCYNEHDEVLTGLFATVEPDTSDFDEFSLYVSEGRCMLPEEYKYKLHA